MTMLTDLTQLVVHTLLSRLLLLFVYLQQTFGSVSTTECVCPGDILTYECTVMGGSGGVTIWNGTAFQCSSSANAILLLNFQFSTYSTCNGAIMARILSAEGNNYTSQLNVTVISDTAGKTIGCYGYNEGIITNHFFSVIPTPGPMSPPNQLYAYYISNKFSQRELTFSWSPVAPGCPAIHYNILASNCGSCPTATNHTTVTCNDVPTNSSVCTFAVQTVVCGNIAGNLSNPIRCVSYPIIGVDTSIFYSTQDQDLSNSDTNTAYLISTTSLATALIVCVVVSITAIALILRRSKAKINTTLELLHRAEGTTGDESMYEDVIAALPSVSTFNTQDNVAYGHTQTSHH